MTSQIQVLNGSGHLTLEWNPDDEAEVARVREEVENLRRAGYVFFLTENEPADAVAAGKGKLLVKRIDDPVVELSEPPSEEEQPDAPKRRGRPPREAVAVRRMAGG